MIWKKPMVKIGPVLVEDDHKFIDKVTWSIAYKRGYREPRYPVPAVRHEVDFHFEEVTYWEPYGGDGVGNYIWRCRKLWSVNGEISPD